MLLPACIAVRVVADATYDVHRPIQLDIARQHARIERQLVAPDPYVKPECLSAQEWRAELEASGQHHFQEASAELQRALNEGSTEAFWHDWCQALHATFAEVEARHVGSCRG
eukprot:2480499-Alexandrium_andersonii.AAC.1